MSKIFLFARKSIRETAVHRSRSNLAQAYIYIDSKLLLGYFLLSLFLFYNFSPCQVVYVHVCFMNFFTLSFVLGKSFKKRFY